MQENLLHFIWQNKAFDTSKLHAETGETMEIIHPGVPNRDEGPDFLDARIRLGDKLWAGNVEIHVKASDWFAHGHENDPQYDSVILHVVHDYDMPVFNTKNAEIPTFSLKNLIPPEILKRFNILSFPKHRLACKVFLPELNELDKTAWLDRLFVERLEQKTARAGLWLQDSVNDWEAVLYQMLFRYFGMPRNSDAFEHAAKRLPFKVVARHRHDPDDLQALLFGITGLLESPANGDPFQQELKQRYDFLRHKYRLQPGFLPLQFGRMRPVNFPTIRLAQLAMLLHQNESLFNTFIKNPDTNDILKKLQTPVPDYWKTHYLFGRPLKAKPKRLGSSFARNLFINVILPLKWAYATYRNDDARENVLETAGQMPPENNRITRLFAENNIVARSVKESQALIQLYEHYCTQNKCLSCAWGNRFLKHAKNR